MFAPCEPWDMTIADLRSELGLTYAAFAQALGLASRGQARDLEAGRVKCSVRVALEIERLSGNRIAAESLNADVALVRAA